MNESRPGKLYKYQPFSDYALANLAENKLRFSSPKDFNDPFEFCVQFDRRQPDADEAVAIREICRGLAAQHGVPFNQEEPMEPLVEAVEEVSKRKQREFREVGVACFSAINDHPLMWAHYSDGHRGFCLEFSTRSEPFAKAIKVNYRETIPKIDLIKAMLEDDLTGYFHLAVANKLRAWRYEKEWRCFHVKKGGTLFGYEPSHLTAIYFGLRMKDAHKKVLSAILAKAPTKLYQMIKSSGGYEVEAQPCEFSQPDYRN